MKAKTPTVEKVYVLAKKLIDAGKVVRTAEVAQKLKVSLETARLNLLKLVKHHKLLRDRKTKKITDYK